MDDKTLAMISTRQGINYASGFGSVARLRKCGRCGGTILKGLDDEWCAGEATVEPAFVSEVGEALALLDGRSTYRLLGQAKPQLFYRNAEEIRHGHLSGWRVVVEHRCGKPIPSDWVKV